jgi:antirestriction protein ArdC
MTKRRSASALRLVLCLQPRRASCPAVSAFLCADLELHLEPREDNAAYIATWQQVLTNDNRAIFTTAAHTQRAADYLNQKAASWVSEASAGRFPVLDQFPGWRS